MMVMRLCWAHCSDVIGAGLVPPAGVWEGVVTDSSVEILWDKAKGQHLSYEVICSNCSAAVQVSHVNTES